MKTFRRILCFALITVVAGCVSPLLGEPQRKAIIVYGDMTNALEYAGLLRESGLQCELVAQDIVYGDLTNTVEYAGAPQQSNSQYELASQDVVAGSDVRGCDLVVILSCCSGGWFWQSQQWESTFLDKIGNARVLACGDTGAALLQTKHLLVGHPNGWHGMYSPKRVLLSKAVLGTEACVILKTPHDLQLAGDESVVEIHSGTNQLVHIGIYDGGKFPAGTVGIGREEKDPHHWMICRQGNFTLWGANSLFHDLTPAGRDLFANLAVYLAQLPSQPLVFPEKLYLRAGNHDGVLAGGSQNMYYIKLDRAGPLNLTLSWDTGETMMFMSHGSLCTRVDGKSPLTISHNVPERLVGEEIWLTVISFKLEEGRQIRHTLGISH